MLCYDGKLSLFCFTVASLIAILPEVLLRLEFDVPQAYFNNIWITHLFQYGFLNFFLLLAFRGFSYKVAVRAVFLGYAFGCGILLSAIAVPSWQTFGIYITMLAIFHYSEFLSIAWINPSTLSIDSFILNHSIAYGMAACSSWVEFTVERQYFPGMKELSFVSYFGLILCICGEVLRKLAMFTAKHNFNHIVQSEKMDNHELVTYGVYKLCRHPSYVGWFYWSIGTQLILQNPFCLLAYAAASWRFFHDRILIEEITLLNFFGQDYVEYQKRVGTGLPFIPGYKLNL
ncbi:PREDICTED: protein-S-isoprenylcysteine O-methyltransferase [Dufourea novaeangliae]|uniref:Protein-S-isoprenylcysteine O-methyltransferase n=1 Tax=Dufourea novaeangliae TaxID=178035 RepID=A0A154PRU5_DUFNO|nr:PREDICTED: protein-S-isoprenylcysteine O-methyltransferase [Dufourea novaeangliae]XP_015437520.1 PREDICTED: protein-S-isoprenylcysteine O-methyltransferase [Dufourea novaeangliae]KZC14593.1 Protein-S-isoprenylcysteine O-methyltransferase [Dufourea novaeangliae]